MQKSEHPPLKAIISKLISFVNKHGDLVQNKSPQKNDTSLIQEDASSVRLPAASLTSANATTETVGYPYFLLSMP